MIQEKWVCDNHQSAGYGPNENPVKDEVIIPNNFISIFGNTCAIIYSNVMNSKWIML